MKEFPLLRRMIDTLAAAWGPQGWWPAESPFEVIVGAILTQNTAWTNVERAIANVRAAGLLHPHRLRAVPREELETLIRPSGFFRQKAERLHLFLDWFIARFDGDCARMGNEDPDLLRGELLALKGIGPETADAILCYAAGFPVFVVDAYTLRLFSRHDLCAADARYDQVQVIAHTALPRDTAYLNEAHGLIVQAGKRHCFKQSPDCAGCPLGHYLEPQI